MFSILNLLSLDYNYNHTRAVKQLTPFPSDLCTTDADEGGAPSHRSVWDTHAGQSFKGRKETESTAIFISIYSLIFKKFTLCTLPACLCMYHVHAWCTQKPEGVLNPGD